MGTVRFLDPTGVVRTGTWLQDSIQWGNCEFDPESVQILPPTEPTKIVCAARNYADAVNEVPESPDLFLKSPNSVAGHDSVVTPPSRYSEILFEGELAVVIGEECRNVSASDADNVIAGYTCANDITNDSDDSTFRRKAFDGSCPIGPTIAPANVLPEAATIKVNVNGELRQRSSIDNLIYTVDELIATVTDYMTLQPGDILLTGTPEGRGTLQDGDEVSISIEEVGTLEHTVET